MKIETKASIDDIVYVCYGNYEFDKGVVLAVGVNITKNNIEEQYKVKGKKIIHETSVIYTSLEEAKKDLKKYHKKQLERLERL